MKFNQLGRFFVSTLISLIALGYGANTASAYNREEVNLYVDKCKAQLIREAQRHPELADPSRAERDMDACMRENLGRSSTETSTNTPTSTSSITPSKPSGNNTIIWWFLGISLLLLFLFMKKMVKGSIKAQREAALASVRKAGHSLQFLSYSCKNDKDIVLAAVSQVGSALQFASDTLRNDKEVVMAAVSQIAQALQYASGTLRNDKEVVMAAVKQRAHAFKFDGFYKPTIDKNAALWAAACLNNVLEDASETLRNDKEFVTAAEKQFAKDDKEITQAIS